LSRTLTDKADAERVDQPREAVVLARLDFIDQILRRFSAIAVERGDIFDLQFVQIRKVLHQALVHKLIDNFFRPARRCSWRAAPRSATATLCAWPGSSR